MPVLSSTAISVSCKFLQTIILEIYGKHLGWDSNLYRCYIFFSWYKNFTPFAKKKLLASNLQLTFNLLFLVFQDVGLVTTGIPWRYCRFGSRPPQ